MAFNVKDRTRKMAKKAFDLGWTEHSNKLIAKILLDHAKKLPAGQTKDRQTALANYITTHSELCYADFKKWADDQWYPDYDLLRENLKAVKIHPAVHRIFVKHSETNHDMEKINDN